ncbi:dienelactone hydrolase family protein [Sphingosinicella terrae]|uniref:dienelactone hydrolase family protein n=1 Tax=Sphingosinicella terrae TaxID=2172047 RepID=UPI0013B45798|nr:dienelactone hydrolase family protein [Sphingosinicella terrae]
MEHRYAEGATELVGYVARPEGSTRRPGILVAHEAPGLGEHPKMRARMLAELGYVALAADLYGGGALHQGPAAFQQLSGMRSDPGLLRRRVTAGFESLAALEGVDPGRIAAIGFCLGGMAVLELARTGADLRAAVSFHGLLETRQPAAAGAVRAPILACTGSEDPLVPPEQVAAFEQEMSAAQADWQLVTFGGARHAFTNRHAAMAGNAALEWKPQADRRAWAFMVAFLADCLGEEG